MLMIGGFDPLLSWRGQEIAKKYIRNLAKVGNWFSIGGGALFFLPITQEMALAIGCAMMAIALFLGREYRPYVNGLLAQTSLIKLLMLVAPSWRFLLITTLLIGAGVGFCEWEAFGQMKAVVIGVVTSSAVIDFSRSKSDGAGR